MDSKKSPYPDKPGQPFIIPKEEMPQVRLLTPKELRELGLLEKKSKLRELPEPPLPTPETLRDTMKPFLVDTFVRWYGEDKRQKAESAADHLPELILPENIDYEAKKVDNNPSQYGEYTLNPDTISLDWETIPEDKIKIETLPASFNDKPLSEVAKYVIETYQANYHIPGIEYWRWILENPDKAPASLKDKNSYYFFGSVLCDAGGWWRVLFAKWHGTVLDRNARWLAGFWRSSCRAVLVER